MNLKTKSLLAAAVMGFGAASAANAAILLNVNLQLQGGGSTQTVQAGHTYTLDVYATPVGTDTLTLSNLAVGVKSQQSASPLQSTLSNGAFVGSGWNTLGAVGTTKNPSFNGVVTDTDWGGSFGSVTGWMFASQAAGTYISSSTVDGVANSVQIGTVQWTAPAVLPAAGSSVTLTAIPELNSALTKGSYQYKLGTTSHGGALEASSTVGTGTGVTFSVAGPADAHEFMLGAGTQGESVTTTVNMTQSPNHTNPNYTPELPVNDPQKGLIVINNLDAGSLNNVLLVWSTLDLAGLQSTFPAAGFAAVDAQKWGAYGATAELVLPTGQTSYTLAYDFKPGTGTLTGIAVVPEPASLGLLALGALGLLGKRRSK